MLTGSDGDRPRAARRHGRAGMAAPPDDVARLSAVIAEQRELLDGLRDRAAARSVTDVAAGVLVARLGCSPGEAIGHLARLAAGTGTTLADLAADLIDLAADDPLAQAARRAAADGRAPSAHRRAELAIEHAEDGDAVVTALLDEVLALAGTGAAAAPYGHGPEADGAVAAALWRLRPDGALDLVGAAGLDPAEAGRWRRVPPQMDCLQQRVLRAGRPVWWPAPPGRRAGVPPLAGPWTGARAVLPLELDGRATGVLEICWARARADFPAGTRAEITALARACARTIGRHSAPGDDAALDAVALLDAVTDAYLVLSPVRGPDGSVTDLCVDHAGPRVPDRAGRSPRDLVGRRLSHVLPGAALAGGPIERGAGVLATGRPADAAWPADGVPASRVRLARIFDRLVVTWPAGGPPDPAGDLLDQAQRLGAIGTWHHDLVTRRTTWTDQTYALFGLPPSAPVIGPDELSGHVHPQDRDTVRRFHERLPTGRQAAVTTFRLIRSDGSVRHIRAFAEPVAGPSGAVAAVRGVFQDVTERYQSQVVLAATRDRLADTEQLAADQRRLAAHLQRAIMPPAAHPVASTGLDVAVRYRAAGEGELGGDWYEAVVLPGEKVLLAVGDVAGHGLDAVTGMVALRNSLRGLAVTGAGPARLLGWLNKAAYHLTGGTFATAICALYDPRTHELEWARAGHLPPVLVRDGTADLLPLPAGFLLGLAPDAGYEQASTTLRPGDALLLFTDGLIERRDIPLDEALGDLIALAGRPVEDAESFSDGLLGGTTANTDDDTCLVTIHVR